MMPGMTMRLVLGTLALVVAAWSAIALREAHAERRAGDILAGEVRRVLEGAPTPDRERVAEAGRLLHRGEPFQPDSSRELQRGTQLLLAGRPRAAIGQLRRLVAREPENVQAWSRLATSAVRRVDPGLAARASRRVRELDPRGAAAR
jgi:hypothetical protein